VSGLDLSPAPSAAPVTRRVLRHAGIEVRLLVRNGEQVLLALVIPLTVLVVGRYVSGPFGDLGQLAPSVLALAVWSTSFTSLAIATAFERRYGVLERLAATPLARPGVLAGKAVATAAVVLGQLMVLAAVAVALGWRPDLTPGAGLLGLLTVALSVLTFAALALALAGRLRAESVLGLANVIYVLLLAGGGLVLAVDRYPAVLQPVIALLPTAALGEGLRSYAAGSAIGWPLAVLGGWLVVAAVAAWRGFRWVS
jgi:ABC-2 type transport system permease protein